MNLSYLKQKYHEAFLVEPSNLGNPVLTKAYKQFSSSLKVMPFLYLIPLSFCIALIVSFIFGFPLVKLATILQHAF